MEKEKHEEHDVCTESDTKNFNTSNALIIVVAVLVIMSGVQVLQTQQLLTAVASGAVNTGTQTEGSQTGLPSQVGGCG